MTLDPVDEQLIAALQADARATYADLGARVGLSAPGINAEPIVVRTKSVIVLSRGPSRPVST